MFVKCVDKDEIVKLCNLFVGCVDRDEIVHLNVYYLIKIQIKKPVYHKVIEKGDYDNVLTNADIG